jgi:hypothetical protein
MITVRFDLGSILNTFGQAATTNNNNNNKQPNPNDPVGNILGDLLNTNIAVSFNDQGQILISESNNNNGGGGKQPGSTQQQPQPVTPAATPAPVNQPNPGRLFGNGFCFQKVFSEALLWFKATMAFPLAM